VISAAQELVNDLSRELAGPEFERFEALPLLLTELTELHIERDLIKENIKSLRADHEVEVQKMLKELENSKSSLQREEMKLAELERNLIREVEKERQLLSFLELTDDSSKAVAQMESAVTDSRNNQKEIREGIEKQTQLREGLEAEISTLRSRIERKKAEEVEGLRHEEEKLERTTKAIVIKEEDIEEAERFPPDSPRYPGRLVIEVRREIGKKIEWLNRVIEYFQEKYMRRMTTAKLRFNMNITRAFEQLVLEGFANIFLDQDFALHIVREDSLQQPVETLSASERLTISLILMLAAKETFLPDFPFFIIDELTLSYDPERFRHIVNYIQQHVPYVIVTTLASAGIRGEPEVTFVP
jgi:DNA repair exonuclease SbcCD ATPase subunit